MVFKMSVPSLLPRPLKSTPLKQGAERCYHKPSARLRLLPELAFSQTAFLMQTIGPSPQGCNGGRSEREEEDARKIQRLFYRCHVIDMSGTHHGTADGCRPLLWQHREKLRRLAAVGGDTRGG